MQQFNCNALLVCYILQTDGVVSCDQLNIKQFIERGFMMYCFDINTERTQLKKLKKEFNRTPFTMLIADMWQAGSPYIPKWGFFMLTFHFPRRLATFLIWSASAHSRRLAMQREHKPLSADRFCGRHFSALTLNFDNGRSFGGQRGQRSFSQEE